MRGTFRFLLALLMTLGVCVASAQTSNPRLALVIGASTYPDVRLATPVNDASLIASVLRSAGFEVTGAMDPEQGRLRELFRDFLRRARAAGPDMQAFVYFAGRAIQYEGRNYLVPVDARIDRAADTPIEAVRLDDLMEALADTPGVARIIVIDGARPNPYAKQGGPLAGGLALTTPARGSLIGFDAAPGAVGEDASGGYDVYAKALADQLRQGGVSIADVFDRTRLAVNEATKGAVAPWSDSKLAEPYFLFARATETPPSEGSKIPPSSTPLKQLAPAEAYDVAVLRDTLQAYKEYVSDFPDSPQAERVRAMLAVRREALIWRRTRELDTAQAYWSYLKLYPKGPHVGDAERALDILGASTTPPADFQLVDYGDVGSPNAAEVSFAQGSSSYYFGGALGPPPAAAVSVALPQDNFDWENLPAPQTTFTDALPALPFVVPLPPYTRRFHHPRPTGDGRDRDGAEPPPGRAAPAPLDRGASLGTGRVTPYTAPHMPSAGRPTFARPPALMAPIRPLYSAPRLSAPTLRLAPPPRLSAPIFHAAPALPHFAAPHFAAPAPAGRL